MRHGGHRWRARAEVDEALVNELGVREGMVVVDVGSGAGRFAIPMARRVGPGGLVYAIDVDREALDELEKWAREEGLENVRAILADATAGLPLGSSVADLVLMANVLHDFVRAGAGDRVVREAHRVLKPGGLLDVVEFKKDVVAMGPPPWLRIEPSEVIEIARAEGFEVAEVKELGRTHYLVKLVKPSAIARF
ncbi:MAG: methyltransferase domain-containing protein [Desulfurococcaceae archaeon]